ncbi:MAG: hypothetical protein NT062_05195, partial [Proteobacteria bacterium]|nr:hypothetical protein [Pseudomonadota bacterium]
MKKPLIVVLVLAVLVAGGVWLWKSFEAPNGAPQPAAPKPVAVEKPAEAPKPTRRGDAEVPARIMIDDDPKGEETLEGQVIDADDHPVKDAIVVLGSNPPRT